jgi:hypothetical protein
MKQFVCALGMILFVAGCAQNEPGTMGGEPGVPETVATGAPAEAAKGTDSTDRKKSAIESERASSTFDDTTRTNVSDPVLPDASTRKK